MESIVEETLLERGCEIEDMHKVRVFSTPLSSRGLGEKTVELVLRDCLELS